MLLYKCAVYCNKILKFIKMQEVSGLLSELGIGNPLMLERL